MYKKNYVLFLFLLISVIPSSLFALKIDRVIVSSDANPLYLDFWPLVAKTWKKLTGLTPTLILIAKKNTSVDTSVGDIVRFDPIPGINHGFQAQVIRLLAPALFENEGCLISDIDMFPLCKDFFTTQVEPYPDERFPMCYTAAKGSVFKEIFHIHSKEQILEILKKWHSLGIGWCTDEVLLYNYVTTWQHYTTKCIKLGHSEIRRIDRSKWYYHPQKVNNLWYLDAHSIRPYNTYKKEIDTLISLLDQKHHNHNKTIQERFSPLQKHFFCHAIRIKGKIPLIDDEKTGYRQKIHRNKYFRLS